MPEEVPVLQVDGISKSFDGVEVVSNVSLQVYSGETISILGPSGSGKSTLLRCINWLEKPDRGDVYLAGKRVGRKEDDQLMSDHELASVRTQMGMVFQSFNLWPHFTVLQNVIEAPVHVLGVSKDDAVLRGEQLLFLLRGRRLEESQFTGLTMCFGHEGHLASCVVVDCWGLVY